ncbi:hypothetical protein JW906_03495 [bacterium]|nr:hypothetical protein [bacterium]
MKIRILFLMAVPAAVSLVQAQPFRLQSDRIGTCQAVYESWKAKDDKITEFAFPFSVVYPFGDKTKMYAVTAPAFSNLDTGEKFSLGGWSDLKIGGHSLVFDDKMLLTFGLNLPTGKHALTSEQVPVASVLAMPAFNFRVPTLGQGLDVQAGLNGAGEFGDFVVGYGATYLIKGPFQPFDGLEDSYNPGDEITFALGADRNAVLLGREMRLTADVLYTLYFPDTWGEEKVFQSGNRIWIQVMSTFKWNEKDVAVLIRERIKGKNKKNTGEVFDLERKNSNANQFEIQAYLYAPPKEDMQLYGTAEIRLYSKNDFGSGGATLFGPGCGIRKRTSPGMTLTGEARIYFGNLSTGTKSVSATGFKLSGGLEYLF